MRLPHFPVGLWTKGNIIVVALAAGKPLSLVPSTRDRSKILFARVKVMIDLAAPLQKAIWLCFKGERLWQSFFKKKTESGISGKNAL